MKHFVSTKDLSKEILLSLFDQAHYYKNNAVTGKELAGKTMSVLFMQPSTRTRISFESAMLKLGGHVTGAADIKSTRAGDFFQESLTDTVQVFAELTDILVIRHFIDEAAKQAALVCNIPIINAGDGENEHPTQALGDLWMMYEILHGLDGKTIALVGSLKNRTYRSFLYLCRHFKLKKLVLLLPPDETVPPYAVTLLSEAGIAYEVVENILDCIAKSDIIELIPVYLPDYNVSSDNSTLKQTLADHYILNRNKLLKANPSIPILHPGPRMAELSTDIDDLSNFRYFEQVRYCAYMRMAILNELLS